MSSRRSLICIEPDKKAWNWPQRLALHWFFALCGPVIDLFKISRRRRGRGETSARAMLDLLFMPVVGSAAFLALFSTADPLISTALASPSLLSLSPESILRALFWCAVFIGVLGILHPRWHKPLLALPERKIGKPSALLTRTITLSLIVFNAAFALQNSLDIAFLWSGAPLPWGHKSSGIRTSRCLSLDLHSPACRPVRLGEASAGVSRHHRHGSAA